MASQLQHYPHSILTKTNSSIRLIHKRRRLMAPSLLCKQRPALSRWTVRLGVILVFFLLLLAGPRAMTAQTPQPSRLAITAPAENVLSTARDKAAQPNLSTGRVPDRAEGVGSIFKWVGRGFLRFGKGLLSVLRFGEGRSSSVAKSNPTLEKQDQVVVLKPVAAVNPPPVSTVAAGNAEITETNNDLLIFEGTVIRIAERPPISCGVMAVYQLAKYRVSRVLQGEYDRSEIVVDHLACTGDLLAVARPGDTVVVVSKRGNVLQRWNAEGIREKTGKVTTYYVALSLTRKDR